MAPAVAARRTSCSAKARFSRITPLLVSCVTATSMEVECEEAKDAAYMIQVNCFQYMSR